MRWRLVLMGLLLAVGAGLPAAAEEAAGKSEAPSEPLWEYDAYNAQDIMETCAACHGKNGEGGSEGTYPRLAGLRAKYIAKQLRAFKAKERINIPMYPYAIERDLPEPDVLDISRYLSKVELRTEMPELDESASALERLRAADSVFNVPRFEGDEVRGAELYEQKCRKCHGKEGWGRGSSPQLAGQWSPYVERQIELYKTGERTYADERMKTQIDTLTPKDVRDLLAWLSTRDD